VLAFGLIILAIAAGGGAVLAWAASSSSAATTVTILGVQATFQPLHFFLAGIAMTLLLWLGFKLALAGSRRTAARKRELKELRKVDASRPAPSAPPVSAPAGAGGSSVAPPRSDTRSSGSGADPDGREEPAGGADRTL